MNDRTCPPKLQRRLMTRFQQIVASEPQAISRQQLLEKAASRMLRKAKFYPKRDKTQYPVDADTSWLNTTLDRWGDLHTPEHRHGEYYNDRRSIHAMVTGRLT